MKNFLCIDRRNVNFSCHCLRKYMFDFEVQICVQLKLIFKVPQCRLFNLRKHQEFLKSPLCIFVY
jgi:hypothetical protein